MLVEHAKLSSMNHYKDGLIENVHYIVEGERVVFTALFHLQRGSCCGNGCRECPYDPKHKKGTTSVKETVSKK